MNRETQCKIYQSLTIIGVLLLIVKAFGFNLSPLGLTEPVHVELNTPAMKDEYEKQYEIPKQKWVQDEETGKWILVVLS